MTLGDRVWFTGNAQWLWDKGYEDPASSWLLHCYGIIAGKSTGGNALVSFHMFCNYDDGYKPYAVWVPQSMLKLADLTPEYIEESEGDTYTCLEHKWIARIFTCPRCVVENG